MTREEFNQQMTRDFEAAADAMISATLKKGWGQFCAQAWVCHLFLIKAHKIMATKDGIADKIIKDHETMMRCPPEGFGG